MGRPSVAPGVRFRCFLVSCFEGTASERSIACRVPDSLRLRKLLFLDSLLSVSRETAVDVL